MTRNQSPSEPMSAPVFYTKRIVDCTFQSKKQIANLVCDICLVFRNFMIAFNLDLDFLKHLLFLLYNCAKLFCYQVEYFYMWILDFGGGGEMGVYMNVHAMQCSMRITECQSGLFVCLLDVTVICVYM